MIFTSNLKYTGKTVISGHFTFVKQSSTAQIEITDIKN